MINRLLAITLFHAVFATFGDIEANFMSLLSVPLSQLFNESIQQNYGFVPTENQIATAQALVASMLFIGILFGAFLTGKFMDSMGRKALGVYLRGILGLIASLSAILSSLLTSIELFALSHFLTGVGVSLKIVLIIYLSECAPDESRGFVSIMLASGVAILQLVVQPLYLPEVFGNVQNWSFIPLINIVLCVIHLIIGSLFPQSPKHLYLNKHQKARAKDSLMFYQGRNVDTDQILNEYECEKSLLNSEHLRTLKEIWNHPEAKLPFIIVCIASFVPATSAVAVKSQYLQQIFVDMHMSPSTASFAILTLTFATTPFALLAPFLIEKVGRRPLFLTMSILCIVEWGFLGLAQVKSGTYIGAPIGFFGIAAGNVAFMLGLLNITPVLINEICPFAAKAKATEFIQFTPVLVSLLTVVLYLPVVKAFGPIYHLIMLLISLTLFFIMYRLLPETRLAHIDSVVRQLLHVEEEVRTTHYGSIDTEEHRRMLPATN